MNIQLRHLEYFIAVAEELNFRHAAEKLFVSQPSLSLQISQLEEALGVRLLDRNKRQVSLTEPGKAFYKQSLHILDTIEKSITDVRSLAGIQPLNVGLPDFHSFELISRALHDFSANNPDIIFHLNELAARDMYDAISAAKIDIGFMGIPLPPLDEDKLKTQYLFTENYLICLPPSHPAHGKVALTTNAFDNDKFFMMPRKNHPSFHDMIVNNLRAAGFTLDISYEAANAQAQYSLVAADLGMCLALESSPLPQGLEALPLEPSVIECKMGIVWHPRSAHANLQVFINSIIESVRTPV